MRRRSAVLSHRPEASEPQLPINAVQHRCCGFVCHFDAVVAALSWPAFFPVTRGIGYGAAFHPGTDGSVAAAAAFVAEAGAIGESFGSSQDSEELIRAIPHQAG